MWTGSCKSTKTKEVNKRNIIDQELLDIMNVQDQNFQFFSEYEQCKSRPVVCVFLSKVFNHVVASDLK